MKNIQLLLVLLFLILITPSCEKEQDQSNLILDRVKGYVQKGPYLNGTAITISELSFDLIPTGKTFTSQILDNKGTFEIRNIELSSEYVELKADGFYFNEIKKENSSAQLTLFVLSDLTDRTTLNVNVLSSLEKRRAEYLISNGSTFSEAKKQAQSEILRIFEIEKSDMTESENLDISQTGEDNAILLAVSVILQGHLSIAELSELLANISTDIREDGMLNSETLGESLINNAKLIKTDEIRSNLEERYESLGFNATIPDFERYLNQFINNTEFEFTAFIEYPTSGKHGLNILDKNKTEYLAGDYSMKAILPSGTSLKVKISGLNWAYPAFQQNTGWERSSWNDTDHSRIFTSTRTGEIDFEIRFHTYQDSNCTHQDSTCTHQDSTWSNVTKIYVYENDDIEPTWTKEITVF